MDGKGAPPHGRKNQRIIDTGKELEISYSRLKEMAQRVAAGIIKRNIKEEKRTLLQFKSI